MTNDRALKSAWQMTKDLRLDGASVIGHGAQASGHCAQRSHVGWSESVVAAVGAA